MGLHLKKRHTDSCREGYAEKNPGKVLKTYDNSQTRCKCSWWGEGTLRLDGFVRQSTKQSSLEKAKSVATEWESAGTVNAVEAAPESVPAPVVKRTTFSVAKADFEAGYLRAKHLAPGTQRGYRTMLKFLTSFADKSGLGFIDEFDLGRLQDWQKAWALNPASAGKRLELARCFFDFCVDRGWIPVNPTKKVHVPHVGVEQKEPFTEEEIKRILQACDEYPTKNVDTEGPRIKAMALLMLYTGMRISDASFFAQDQLDEEGRITYFPIKANDGGESRSRAVTVKVPALVAATLSALPVIAGKYVFTTGVGSMRTVTDVWRKKFDRVFVRAAELLEKPFTSHPHPHRFRHTFAVRLLVRGVKIEDVSDALGHSDHRITLRHYRCWVPGLQHRLDAILDDAWSGDFAANAKATTGKSEKLVQMRPAVVNG